MAVFSANAVQTIAPGEDAIFTTTLVPCTKGLIRHRDDTGSFLLKGAPVCRCKQTADYIVDFGANIAVAEGGTAEAISVAITLNGAQIPASNMIVTPAAVGEYFNVSREIGADVWAGCCESLTVRNTSAQPITMQNAVIDINRKEERYARR